MKSINNHFHSVFRGNIKISQPIATQNLRKLIESIKTPDANTVDLINKIRTETDDGKRALLKHKLNAYTPCVLCGENRQYSQILEFSGLLALDFDKLESVEYAKEFKQYIFDEHPFIYASWLSSSGKGVRALVHIPVAKDVDDFKLYYKGLESEIMMQFEGYDDAPFNAVLPLFQSHDPDLIYRETAEVWETKAKPVENPVFKPMTLPNIQDRDVVFILNNATKAINQIVDHGHPPLRATSFTLGGYVGAGYLFFDQAEQHMHALIDSHSYLSKKANVYKRTATEMIRKGIDKPLYLN